MELRDLDFNDIEKLMDDFKKSEMRELEITTDGFHIHLSKNEIPFLPVREKLSNQRSPPLKKMCHR